MTCRTLIALLLGGTAAAPLALAGPLSPLYVTGIQPGQFNQAQIKVVQGSSVVNGWDQFPTSTPQNPFILNQTAIAVTSTVKTWAGICSGACDPLFPPYESEYTLSGTFVASGPSTAPLASPGQRDYLYDGTTDGTFNYALGS